MRPGREKECSIIEDRFEQATSAYSVDPYDLGLYPNLVNRLLRVDPPVELDAAETKVVLRGLKFVVQEESKHPYATRAINMLDEYEIALL